MDSPFFTNRRNYPTRKQYWYEPTPKTHATKKVVTVPVQFIGSEKKIDRIDSATRIQKVFRGFLVRKNLKKIATIRSEVNEFERRLKNEEAIEIITRDGKERLRLNEMLMNLLFKLDSVRGVDSGVRDCRKAVVKKAIMLQEMIDAVVADNDSKILVSASDDNVKQSETEEKSEKIEENETPIADGDVDTEIHSYNNVDREKHKVSTPSEVNGVNYSSETETLKPERTEEDDHSDNGRNHEAMNQSTSSPLVDDGNNAGDVEALEEEEESNKEVNGVNTARDMEATEDQVTAEQENNNADVANQEINGVNYTSELETLKLQVQVTEENMEEDPLLAQHVREEEGSENVVESGEESETDSSLEPPPCHHQHYDNVVDDLEVQKEEEKEGEERKRSRELLEKMMEENEKMMTMMAELFERNETQTRLLSSLSQRVEQLERAFVCQRLRRKKNKNGLVA